MSRLKLTKEQVKKLPRYVRLKNEDGTLGTSLRLVNPEENTWGWNPCNVIYYRDGGNWSVKIKIAEDGTLYSFNQNHSLIHMREIVPTTYWDWKKDNGIYTNRTTKAYRYPPED